MARKRNPVAPDTKLSANFRVREYTRSETAKRMGISNVLYEGGVEHRNAEALFTTTVQPVRARLSCPLFVTSGFRCEELNKAVGGVEDSQHCKAEAVDLSSGRHTPLALAKAFRDHPGLPFDQLILEHDKDIVHVSHTRDGDNRGEVLTRYVDSKGNLQYVAGLVPEEDLS